MTRSELIDLYFDWMYQLVMQVSPRPSGRSYKKLFRYLNSVDFFYTNPMDSNRVADGIELRYRFAYETDVDQATVASLLDDHPCSVMEMLLALAIRCEEAIMYDPDEGDRTSVWFWEMIHSLGLENMSDAHFNQDYVDDIIFRFMNREYLPNGQGGLFTIDNCDEDLRTVEIWYQLCWYLNTYY